MTRDSEERRNGEDAQRLSAPARPSGAEGNRPDSIAHKQLIELQIDAALHAVVPGGAEVWCWLPQADAWTPHSTARDVMRAALEAAFASLITERDERAQEAEDLGEQANRWRNEYGVWRERAETAEALRDELREALAGIKWRSGDKDNMEFVARITCFQMDAVRKLVALHNTTNHGESNG